MPRIAVIAMGRWGGREMSYASDADAMFVMEDSADPESDPTKVAAAVINEMRKLLTRPAADPPLSIDTDLRPEARAALIRSLSAYRNYYSRWSSTWELQALVRADALAGDEELAGLDGRDRCPPLAGRGLTTSQLTEIRKLKARVEAERLPRGANPAKHTKLGPGGIADVEWTVQLLQLQHAHGCPLCAPRKRSWRCGPPAMPESSTQWTPDTSRRRGRWPADPQPDHADAGPRL